jgi:hypothetical protein
MNNTQKTLAVAASALLMGAPTAALAHTNSIGYVGDGNGGVTFWYGSWHQGTTFTEGSMTLQGVNGNTFAPTTVNWTLLQNTQPTGLIPGTNYFMSDGVNLIPYGDPAAAYGSTQSYTWQGVSFTNLGAGDYQFTYNPIAQPTMDWDPSSQVIRTGTVSLSAGLLSGDADGDGVNDSTGQSVTPSAPSTPTVVSTAAGSDIVTTSSSSGTRTVTNNPHRHVMGTDANGNQTETHYTDTEVITIPTTTTFTTTTPTTVDTYSDGSTVTNNGTPTTTSVTTDDNNGTSVVTQATVPDWVKTRTYDVQRTAYAPSGAAPTVTQTHRFNATENASKQKVNHHITTGVTTPTIRTVTTTPVYTKVYTNGAPTVVTTDPSVITYETSTSYAEYYASRDYFGRVDQLEVLDGVNDSINGLLDHEPITNHKKRFRVFENTRFTQSYNADGYKADARILGGGFEYDLTKGWTAGAQYNQININLNGVDSNTNSTRQHIGLFNSFHGRDIALVTNAGASLDNYNYTRTVEGIFNNAGETKGQQWWVHNRLYANNSGWFKPFLGYTVSNVRRDAYTETGSPQSARSVDAFNKTTHVGEAGLKLETRFGGKKNDVFGVSVDGAYGTDNSYGVTAALDYKEVLFVEGSHGVSDGVTTNSVAAKVKFRF